MRKWSPVFQYWGAFPHSGFYHWTLYFLKIIILKEKKEKLEFRIAHRTWNAFNGSLRWLCFLFTTSTFDLWRWTLSKRQAPPTADIRSRRTQVCLVTTWAASVTMGTNVSAPYHWQGEAGGEAPTHGITRVPEGSEKEMQNVFLDSVIYFVLGHSGGSEISLFHSGHSNHRSFAGNSNSKPCVGAVAADENSAGHYAVPSKPQASRARKMPFKWRNGYQYVVCMPRT